jgi:hypothetical protein
MIVIIFVYIHFTKFKAGTFASDDIIRLNTFTLSVME